MNEVVWLEDVTASDVETVGGKGANLGELVRAGFPAPPGFVVTAGAYLAAMEHAGVREQLAKQVLDLPTGTAELAECAAAQQHLITEAGMPAELRRAIADAYDALGARLGRTPVKVAVRSSATAEDAADTSFAGMNSTFTNIEGGDEVADAVIRCWASLFGERSLAYRAAHGLTEEPAIAVVVQAMVPSTRAGVAFTADPATGDRSRVVIEGAFGQGEVVVSGAVEPDTYVVAKDRAEILDARIGDKKHKIVAGATGDETVELDAAERRAQVLTDAEILAVADLAARVERHYGRPQDIEWCFDEDGTLHLLQARPMTALGGAVAAHPASSEGEVLARGMGASPGVASGKARLLFRPEDGGQLLDGEVLVAPMTNPDWLPTMRRAAAVVTDSGGITCHAAIASRELGVPCVVGTGNATTSLPVGELITVDGSAGTVVRGAPVSPAAVVATPVIGSAATASSDHGAPTTATKLYVNLALAERAEEVAAMPVDGVGLLRAEFLLTEALKGRHPRQLLAEGGRDQFLETMTKSVTRIGRAFAPRPVVYRTIDFRTNEFRDLGGGEAFEPEERNPMIGYRGCYRYVREPELFSLELEMLARVRDDTPNVHLMIPFVRTRWELEACLTLLDKSPLGSQRGLKRWVMAEVPSVVYWLPHYAAMGIDGVSIGSNDLTQLVLGVDRDSELCGELFDEEDPAVLDAIRRIIESCRELGLTSSLCGQAPSNRPSFAEHLVRFGIDSVSVNPDAAEQTRRVLAAAEQRVLLDAVIGR